MGASCELPFPIRQWHLLRGTWASEFRSFVLLSDRALGLAQHQFAYTHATRRTRLLDVLFTLWDFGYYYKSSDWLHVATRTSTADYTRPARTARV